MNEFSSKYVIFITIINSLFRCGTTVSSLDLENDCTIAGDCVIPPIDQVPLGPSDPPSEPIPPPLPQLPQLPLGPSVYSARLLSSGKTVSGEGVLCNGVALDNSSSTFTFEANEPVTFSCTLGGLELAEFTTTPLKPSIQNRQDVIQTTFDIRNAKGKQGENATKVLESISNCKHSLGEICLSKYDLLDGMFETVYGKLDNEAEVTVFLALQNEKATDDVGQAPSSHVDSNLVPVITEGTSDDLDDPKKNFFSANAEASLSYKPSEAEKVLTTSQLTDDTGRPLVGMSFFSANSVGTTDENGEFEYLWGDDLNFGIDTFDFGSLKSNQVSYKLSDVTDNPIEKKNIQSLEPVHHLYQ